MVEQRLVSGKPFDEDVGFDQSLRPQTLREYVGQSQVVANLRVAIEAARSRGDALDHVLLFGPPGVGKTSLAHVIAAELGVTLKATSGPVIERAGDLAAILTALEAREILFVDEIHRLDAKVEEILYPALEDCALDLIIGTGPGARTMRIPLKALHPGRGHDARRPADRTAARPLRDRPPSRLLLARRARVHRDSLCADPRRAP